LGAGRKGFKGKCSLGVRKGGRQEVQSGSQRKGEAPPPPPRDSRRVNEVQQGGEKKKVQFKRI